MTTKQKSATLGHDQLASDNHEHPPQGALETSHSAVIMSMTDIAISSSTSARTISSLPQELLVSILDMAQEEASCDDPNYLAKSLVYFAASQVSKFWRVIAINNPLWWTRVLISPPWKLEAIATYLKRSKECPIEIHISVQPKYWNISRPCNTTLPSLSGFGELSDLIYPHFHRCRSLRIQGIFFQNYSLPIYLLKPLGSIDMPHLEEFTFDGEFLSQNQTPDFNQRIPLFSTAPLLRELRMGGTVLMNFAPPLSSVTTLHLSRVIDNRPIKFSELGRVLEACGLLTSFAVYDDFLSNWPGTWASCQVPLLEKLHIFGNMLSVSELLLFLDAPKLKEVVIAPVAAGDLDLLLCHSTSQHVRFPLLTSLTLSLIYPEAFYVLLKASICFPTVELLVLASTDLGNFFKIFTDENSIVFPNLLDIAITVVDQHFAKLLHVVATFRQEHQVALRKIFVDAPSLEVLRSMDVDWYGAEFVEEDIWDRQRRMALYSHVQDLFVGSSDDNSDDS